MYSSKGRAGRVLRIYLKNFMCHSSLEITLNQNVNYLIGRNGSGKSAILTALIVGLGGKATVTNRGSSMSSFIKVGQSNAVVEITLSNDGPMAFKPKKFGKEITVFRTFGETGGSRYKLKDEDGKVVSSAFRDVRRLVEALNIQVDNPVCILNQDVARTFLNTNDTSKKYQMFMKATNIENIQDQYKISVQNRQATITTLNVRKQSLQTLKNESEKWLKKVRILESVNELVEKKKLLQTEIMWCKAYDAEKEMSEKEQEVGKITSDISKLKAQTKTAQKEGLQKLISDIEQQLKEIKDDEGQNQTCVTSVKTKLHQLSEEIFTKKKTIDALNGKIKSKTEDRKVIENELEKGQASQPNKQQILLERTKKIEEYEKKLRSITDLIATTENDLTQTRNALQLKVVDVRDIKEELNDISGKIAQRKAQIRSLKSEDDNSMTVYGKYMPTILNCINEAKEQFSEMPRGPIGSYIKLKDKKWALAVEEFIGFSLLQSFCVNNARDSEILNKIFNRVLNKQPKPTIICSKFFKQVRFRVT